MNSIKIALKIAEYAHKDQVDKAGVSYINHPIMVSKLCKSKKAKIVALLHDVIEDSNVTIDDLKPYFTNDILLLSQHNAPERNDIVLCINEAGRLFLRKVTPFGLDPINRFGKKIPANEMNNYTVLGVVLKVAKEFNIEQYR